MKTSDRIFALLGIVLIFCCPFFTARAGQLVISSLPYTVNQSSHTASLWDTVTISGTKLISATDGVLFAASTHHWLLLLDQDTVAFGTDSTYRPSVYVGARGIDINSYAHDITIKGGYILHQPDNVPLGYDGPFVLTDTVNAYNLCIDGGYQTYNLLVDSVKEARIRGYNSHVMSGGGKMIQVRASRFFNDCYAYDSRELFRATCINIVGNATGLATGEYHYRIENSYLEDNAHAAVYAASDPTSSYCVVQMDGDTVKVDSRNRRYTTYSGTGASTTNAYGIQYTHGGPGSYIKNCVITSGTRYHGGRGIHIVTARGTQANPIEIAYNKISTHEGLNVEFGTLYYGSAVKIRQSSRGVWLHHNGITYTGDTTQTIGLPYQPKGEALMYQQVMGEAPTPPYYITIENNACSTKVLTNTADNDYELAAVDWEECDVFDPTTIYRNNRTYSMGDNYRFGQYDGGGNYVRMTGDSCYSSASSLIPNRVTFNVSDYRGATGNWATDFFYGAGTAPTSVGHYFQGNPTVSGTQDITIKRTLTVQGRSHNGRPLDAVGIGITDAYSNAYSGTTGTNGNVGIVIPYAFYSRTATDLTAYWPGQITSTFGTQTNADSCSITESGLATKRICAENKDYVELERDIGPGVNVLGIPREQILHYRGDTLLFTDYTGGVNLQGLMRVDQFGNGTISRVAQSQNMWYDHNHMAMRNDTVWYFARQASPYNPDTIWCVLYRISGATPVALDSGVISTGAGWGNTYRDNILGAGVNLTGGKMIATVRIAGAATPTENQLYYSSNDYGLTWTYGGYQLNLSGFYTRHDIDPIPGTDSAWSVVLRYQQDPEQWWSCIWNGTSWTNQLALQEATGAAWQRTASSERDPKGGLHIAWLTTTTPTLVLELYCPSTSSTSWRLDTIKTWSRSSGPENSPTGNALGYTALNRTRYGMRLIYNAALSATMNDYALYERKWDTATNTYGPEIRLGSRTNITAFAGMLPLEDTANYDRSIMIYGQYGVGGRQYINVVRDTSIGYVPPAEQSGPPAPTLSSLDSIHSDYLNEIDSARANVQTSTDVITGVVKVCWSTVGYPDSSASDSLVLPYVANSTISFYIIQSMDEDSWLYVSIWTRNSSGEWSPRVTGSRFFNKVVPALFSMTLDSIQNDSPGEVDTFRVNYTTQNLPGADSIGFAFGSTPNLATTDVTVWVKPYVANSSASFLKALTFIEPATLYVRAWTYSGTAVPEYSSPVSANRPFADPGTPSMANNPLRGFMK